jgi:tetratricopeptide (TPR) repeat protein
VPTRNSFRTAAITLGLLSCSLAALSQDSSTSNKTVQQGNRGKDSRSTGSSSSSESGSNDSRSTDTRTTPAPRIAQPEAGGSAITLETSEPLFFLATALNTCGYDADLAASAPIRTTIRQEINTALAASAEARDARDALCSYIQLHTLTDPGRNLAQYVSLAVYLKPPPDLSPIAEETDLPPDSTQIVNVLPLLRTFSEAVHLHAIWFNHRADYEDLVNRVHDPLTNMILNTNIYLGLPVSSYDGRRFLVLLEPMLAPSNTNGRIYSNDFLVVVSPLGQPLGQVRMDQIRHTYLHYEVEPLVYARATAMDRLLPLLKSVQDAPIEFTYKADIVALITECLIKAIEARTMDVGIAKPVRPKVVRARSEMDKFDAENSAYERQAEVVRRQTVQLDVRQGWVLVDYFYDKLGAMEHNNISLKEDIGEMVYGMDVQRELHKDMQVAFLPQGSNDFVRRAPVQLTGLRLAERKLVQGDTATAEQLAIKALTDPSSDHAQANYVLARIALMDQDPDTAVAKFESVLSTSKEPRTLAWSHIYLGRLYDVKPDRQKAIAEYRAALTVRDSQSDTKAAADSGLKQAFALPKRQAAPTDDDTPLDPSGKAEKDAYRPPPPTPTTPR